MKNCWCTNSRLPKCRSCGGGRKLGVQVRKVRAARWFNNMFSGLSVPPGATTMIVDPFKGQSVWAFCSKLFLWRLTGGPYPFEPRGRRVRRFRRHTTRKLTIDIEVRPDEDVIDLITKIGVAVNET